ncbi:anti-sigma regulatory factor [Streptomyces agglomeratus]|uniref:anti-sigma factor RsbA family regulatory protein n=1 Tax=Streptomyces agglomeratus TaxID=285458 RepID=UPI0008527C85|nr:anti-sigma factor RsbA family regulatory protein [Streptomyces agglomeratus]OEJ37370.1 anti-sigma regulatory factor [Streptomyces agglomeratus]OEJ48247.1 anti-sigma regulatory factor [Streptomyces agglomeratus]OEJ57239.1 anti-sigma regulatory factor [Streptomyces agglomeratus]
MTAQTAEPFVHPALFYRGEKEYLHGTVPFIQDGLRAGEPVAVAVPGPNLAILKTALGDDAADVRFLDMTEAGRNPGRIIPKVLRAFADAHRDTRVRIIGEPIWVGRSSVEYPACVQHEALINPAFEGREVTILCPYDAARLDEQVLADAYATHPVVISGGQERRSTAYAPERVVAHYNQPLAQAAASEELGYDADRLPSARHFAVERAAGFGLSGIRLEDVALIVAELTTNSVVHGGGSGTIRVWSDADQVVLEVRDHGYLSDPLAGRRPATRDQQGGRGLLLVHYLSDLVRIHTGPDGTAIRCYISR